MAAQTTTIGVILFDGFELLDTFGPLEFLNYCPGVQHYIITESGNPASVWLGAPKPGAAPALATSVVASYSFDNAPDLDVILLPGGFGTRAQEKNEKMVQFLKKAGQKAKYVLTVCTGSLLFSRTGLLDGRPVTSNKAVMSRPEEFNSDKYPGPQWKPHARWVHHASTGADVPDLWTSSGVAAGMDMTIAFISHVWGAEIARRIAQGSEYTPQEDPDVDVFADIYHL
ncbi:DJ-1/PfpI family protein [Gonapodya prolifera JEL478]|uniref:DJ-1/PfpI family protein n=1 Tax=Gonapodya prolifera (strain JEL478) TaxID=1344416 RepID=A0A139A0S6_GONPJ|nr:DJ-1/PfpI family protein [Gonapodya prolifera JEL478]|eukprot:KXS10379.1 DJ-1/PfpI family protein [Gonapodya prolifera JEL478]